MNARSHEITIRAWSLHNDGRSEEAVQLLDQHLPEMIGQEFLVSLAHARAHILMGTNKCDEAMAGLRIVLDLPPGSQQPGFPSRTLMEDLFTAAAVDGGKMDLMVVRWLLADAQDHGNWQQALEYAVILITSLPEGSRDEAVSMAMQWRCEADRLRDKGHADGLQGVMDHFEKDQRSGS